MESFEHLIRTIFAVLLDIVTFTRLCLRPTKLSPPRTYFSENNWAFLSNETSSHDGLPILSDSHSPDSPAGLIGVTP